MRRLATAAAVALLATGCGSPGGDAGARGGPGLGATVQQKNVKWTFTSTTTTPVNVGSIAVTAPAAGFVRVDSAGYCNMSTATASLNMGIETTSAVLNTPVDHWFVWSGTANSVPYVTGRTFAVPAGTTTFFLVLSSGGASACSGNMTAYFATTQLP